jgi:8-oxo-dGTP pyrophosphatase MutT (NUDIX family)
LTDALISPISINALALTVRATPHVFDPAMTAEIELNWASELSRNPTLFNGSAFLFDRFDLDENAGSLHAEAAPTDYATFLFWRRNRDRLPLKHIFPVGAIVTSDRKLVVGRMSRHTANPGRLYPPAGSFDADDLARAPDGSGTLDPDRNIARELAEEIGIDTRDLMPRDGLLLLPSNPGAYALIRVLGTSQSAHDLQAGLLRHIANDPHQELDDILFLDFATRLAANVTMPYVNHLLAYLEAPE